MSDELPLPDWWQELRHELGPQTRQISEAIDSLMPLLSSRDALLDAEGLQEAVEQLATTVANEGLGWVTLGPNEAGQIKPAARRQLLELVSGVKGYHQGLLEADGLASEVRGILERIGGMIAPAERLIYFYLPRAQLLEGTSEDWPVRLLVVDDSEDDRQLVRRSLRYLGHEVSEVAGGLQALDMIDKGSFDLVLLDLHMPGLDGFGVLRKLRAQKRFQALPVMIVSAQDDQESLLRCIEAGADDYLTKPIDHTLMRARVQSLLLKRRLRIKELEQFFPPQVARQLIDRPEVLEEGQEPEITALFCDIRGYSRISKQLGPVATIDWLSAVMEELVECIHRHEGVLIDFAGDGLFAIWGAPTPQPDHAQRACRAALDMLACLPNLNRLWQDRLNTQIGLGIGINSGVCWVGNCGTRRKFKYGASGNPVNVASRVEGATKYLKAPLIVSHSTHEQLQGMFLSRRLGVVEGIGVGDLDLYQIVPPDTVDWDLLKSQYEQALALYEAQQLKQAAQQLGQLIATHGAEGPMLALMARTIEGLLEPEKWSRVFKLPGK